MYQERHTKPAARAAARAALLACAALLAWGAFTLWRDAGASLREQAAQSVRSAVLDAAVQCYALEGANPRSLSYLEENYGVQVNRRRFIVSYEAYASNQLPEVAVFERPSG